MKLYYPVSLIFWIHTLCVFYTPPPIFSVCISCSSLCRYVQCPVTSSIISPNVFLSTLLLNILCLYHSHNLVCKWWRLHRLQLRCHANNIIINTGKTMAMSCLTRQNRNVVKTTSQIPQCGYCLCISPNL